MGNVLVVGGAGYIGSHVCKALHAAGYTPVVYDNLVYGHEDAVKWGPFEHGDLLDAARLDEVLARYRPSCVMHFAAYAYVGESVNDPAKYYSNNISGSFALLDAMRRNGVDTIVFSSTCATYGEVETLPVSEDMPQAPVNPYGFSKLVVEHALRDYGRAYGLKWVAMRYFNAAGLDPEGELGERHDPETHAIPLAILAAMRQTEFSVFGTDYDTPDGTAIRDYVHVCDLADAHVRAIGYLRDGGRSDAFNLATGRGTSVKELLAAVERAVGAPVPVTFAPRREGDAPMLFATGDKARDKLGWTPQYTDIDAIVRTAADWFRRHHN
ncbi:UDP-glucose 4-epimerase GalE [Rhizobiaceae bacterium BDR2-2]|uniref:UDP-glucose 4-epimerase n=1 Tax=Ectorhizobium quercum TaxID=2965071 RepID=A0AAE3MZU5_9HYPH|nr:UDP-glucose 4-epimerase GalE [Ectorhizobium quercum]MCX8998143.1 UDP-glucose 4-epimerase GalE [Ectorhizobium quercum]